MKMKIRILSVLFVLVASVIALEVWAKPQHDDTATFKVYGNCEMCKKRIETALLKNKNIKQATWDVKSKMVTVVYNPHMITLDAIHQIVADAGHDTDKVKAKAKDSVYKKLPSCCQYERKK